MNLTANPAAGYYWSGWSGTDNNSVNPTTVTMNSSIQSVTASFSPICYKLTKSVYPANRGSISNSPSSSGSCPTDQYSPGTVVNLTANPAGGYYWSGWVGTDNNGLNPTTVTMNGSRTVDANFEPIPGLCKLTMLVLPSGAGTTSPSEGEHWYDCGTVVSISASANSGWQLAGWTGIRTAVTAP